MVIGKTPAVPAFGLPDSVAVPLLLLTSVTPAGSPPTSVIVVATGSAAVVTVKLSSAPTWNVALAALVMIGVDGLSTVSVKLCVADPMMLAAVIVSGYVPLVPVAGVPASVAVPLPLSVNVTPDGRMPPASSSVGAGVPAVSTVNVPGVPTTNVAAFALVKVGG